MSRYAEKTKVPVDRTRNEIESVLTRYGATGFGYGHNVLTGKSQVDFVTASRQVRFTIPMPPRDKMSDQVWGQVQRQRWRALLLAIKAKLEAVECGISEFEAEFLANIVNPTTGKTVGEEVRPVLQANYEGRPQALLLTHAPE